MPVFFHPFPPSRRPSTLRRFAAGLGLVLVGAAGCASEQTVATDLQLSRMVTGQGVELQVDAAARDALALRGAAEIATDTTGPVGGVAPAAPGTAPETIATPSTVTAPPAPSLAPTETAAPSVAPPTLGSTSVAPVSPPLVPEGGDNRSAPPLSATSTTAQSPAAQSPATQSPATQPSTGGGPTVVPAPGASIAPAPATSTATAPVTPPATESAEGLTSGEARSYTLLAELRAGLGLDPLVRDAELDAFARDWSRHMAESGVFDHSTSPYGENIAFTSNTRLTASEAAEVFQRLWVESDVHYQNMTGAYAKVGIGLYRTERGWYGTHAFSY